MIKDEYKEELAVTLLTELLAYQFAFPVRWIETQDVFINDFKAERIIEVGPSPILTNMAARTVRANESHEMARHMRREIYCTSNHLDKIYYGTEPAASTSSKPESVKIEKELEPVAPVETAINNVVPVSQPLSTHTFDSSVTLQPRHIVTALVSNKLPGCKYADLNINKSLKEVSHGKSTLQNEIKSDLIKEFVNLKDDSFEDIPLSELCQSLEQHTLGAVTLAQVIKFMSQSLSGKFKSLSGVRNYLGNEWSIADSNPILLYMAYQDSSFKTRISCETEAAHFIDSCCQAFAVTENIKVITAQATSGAVDPEGGEVKPVISAAEYDAFNEGLHGLYTQQRDVLNKRLIVSDDKSELLRKDSELQTIKDKMTALEAEFGEFYLNESIKRLFSPAKIRVYDSAWNWSRQDILLLIHSNTHNAKNGVEANIRSILNRVDANSLKILQYYIDKQCRDDQWKAYLLDVCQKCKDSMELKPSYADDVQSTMAFRNSTHKNMTESIELNSGSYVKEIALATSVEDVKRDTSLVSTKLDMDSSSYYKIETELFRVYSKIIQYALAASNSNPDDLWGQFESLYEQLLIFIKNSDQIASYFRNIVSDALSSINKSMYEKGGDVVVHDYGVESSSDEESDIDINFDDNKTEHSQPIAVRRQHEAANQPNIDQCSIPVGVIPFLHIKRHSNINEEWIYDKHYTQIFLSNLLKIGSSGFSLDRKTALLLISNLESKLISEIIKVLLQTGATVIVAVGEFSRKITQSLQEIYHKFGSKDSKLVVIPLNQASKVDIKKFCDHIYSEYDDIDFLLPLNVHESENKITSLSSQDEVTLRSVSINLLRLLGHLVEAKEAKQMQTRPTFVLLPLSPLLGSKGASGTLSESYAFLNKTLNRWQIEGWKDHLSICGCMYGWTDEDKTDPVLNKGLDKLGIRTFSPAETAFNVLGLLTYEIVTEAHSTPLVADLNGGLHTLPNILPVLQALKSDLVDQLSLENVLNEEKVSDDQLCGNSTARSGSEINPRGNINLQYPELHAYQTLRDEFNGSKIGGLVDPSGLVVITGFSEIGPWGNARTRWEMESTGVFSLEGCIEMAWIMGLIKYKQKADFNGWIDAQTLEPVDGLQIKEKYEMRILEHTGIRIIEPKLFDGYNPSKKQMLQEVIIDQDLQPIQTSAEVAEQYKLEQGDMVDVFPIEDDQCMVKFVRGASLYIPKALDIERMVAGQVPTGWNAEAYGIPSDITSQVDPTTLFALVSTAEALIASGITDPYEMYEYVHVSEVGNCIGSGIGGMKSHELMQVHRTREEMVQNDILPETFINVIAAWINMLLLSSSGPIKTPVGACATAVESLESGYETIISGKAKICFVGGVDDFHGNISHEFANMGATSNSTDEAKRGREPKEMCRPATSTRNGFMESQGAGVQVLMRGDLAVKMGVPIYGVVGMTATASDKIGRSLPAPGKGVLTAARESEHKPKYGASKLNVAYRKRQLQYRLKEIERWVEDELCMGADPDITRELADDQLQRAKMHWGTDFYKNDPTIAPLRGALNVFGLSIDDLRVASCHGTSTKANEKNESQILNKMMAHLGRAEGNPLVAVFQKALTGHPKGAAGAWMLNGCLQIMNSGIIPGNKNADNIDNQFEEYKYLVYPSRAIAVDTVKACCLTSFGFGQKGAMALVINANFLLACLTEDEYQTYRRKRSERERSAHKYYNDGLVRNKLVQVKSEAPFSKEDEEQFYLNPLARVKLTV